MTPDWVSSQKPLILGHRGASADAPENTLGAFDLALAQGAVGIEFDVRLSASGDVVVIHDATVNRTTNGRGEVSELSTKALQDLDAGMGQSIPTLDEVFEMFGGRMLYNVELKAKGEALAMAVADRIAAHHLEARTIVSSFNPFSVRAARRHLTRSTGVAVIRMNLGFLRYTHLLVRGEADHPHHKMVDERYMAWARKRGLLVNVWTVDTPAGAQRLARLGVNAIITNKPKLIRESLE